MLSLLLQVLMSLTRAKKQYHSQEQHKHTLNTAFCHALNQIKCNFLYVSEINHMSSFSQQITIKIISWKVEP